MAQVNAVVSRPTISLYDLTLRSHSTISQWNRIVQNPVTQMRGKPALSDHIHLAAQHVFQLQDQACRKPRAGSLTFVNCQCQLSTNRSKSLSLPASPRATEPKTRTGSAPCFAAISRITTRCSSVKRSQKESKGVKRSQKESKGVVRSLVPTCTPPNPLRPCRQPARRLRHRLRRWPKVGGDAAAHNSRRAPRASRDCPPPQCARAP